MMAEPEVTFKEPWTPEEEHLFIPEPQKEETVLEDEFKIEEELLPEDNYPDEKVIDEAFSDEAFPDEFDLEDTMVAEDGSVAEDLPDIEAEPAAEELPVEREYHFPSVDLLKPPSGQTGDSKKCCRRQRPSCNRP